MAAKALPAQSVLDQLLSYNPETGELFWKERGPEWIDDLRIRNTWNTRYARKPALNGLETQGYRVGAVLGDHFKAHRVIWKLVTGEDADQIDHIDGDRSNNRWANLRNVCQSDNQRNARMRSDNSSGVVGVYWYPHERVTGKWLATIRGRHIGIFSEFDEAVAARKAAEVENGFHENHGRAAKL